MGLSLRCRNCGWYKLIERRSADDLRLCPRCTSRMHYEDEAGRTNVLFAIAAMVALALIGLVCLPLSCIVAAAIRHR
jgi:hypothetical protein